MNDIQGTNLAYLADHMDRLERKLEMNYIARTCDSPCCAMGEAASLEYFHKQGLSLNVNYRIYVRCNEADVTYEQAAKVIFGLSEQESDSLFGSHPHNKWHSMEVTGPEWAKAAREVLYFHGRGPNGQLQGKQHG